MPAICTNCLLAKRTNLLAKANEPAGEGEREHPLSIPFVMPRVVGGNRKENALKSARVLEAKKLVISLFGASSNSTVEHFVALLSFPLDSDTREKEWSEFDSKEQWTSLVLLNRIEKKHVSSFPAARNGLKPCSRLNNVFIKDGWFFGVIGHASILEQLCDNDGSNILWRALTEKTLQRERVTKSTHSSLSSIEFDWSKSLCDEANENAVKQGLMFMQQRISREHEEDNPENALEGALKANLAEQKTKLAKKLLRILFPSSVIWERIDEEELPKFQVETEVNTLAPPTPADLTQLAHDDDDDDDDDSMSSLEDDDDDIDELDDLDCASELQNLNRMHDMCDVLYWVAEFEKQDAAWSTHGVGCGMYRGLYLNHLDLRARLLKRVRKLKDDPERQPKHGMLTSGYIVEMHNFFLEVDAGKVTRVPETEEEKLYDRRRPTKDRQAQYKRKIQHLQFYVTGLHHVRKSFARVAEFLRANPDANVHIPISYSGMTDWLADG